MLAKAWASWEERRKPLLHSVLSAILYTHSSSPGSHRVILTEPGDTCPCSGVCYGREHLGLRDSSLSWWVGSVLPLWSEGPRSISWGCALQRIPWENIPAQRQHLCLEDRQSHPWRKSVITWSTPGAVDEAEGWGRYWALWGFLEPISSVAGLYPLPPHIGEHFYLMNTSQLNGSK